MTPLVVAAHRARRSARSLAALVRRSLAADADLLAAELVGEWIAADPASTAEDLDRATDAELLALCVRLAASLDEVSLVDTDMTVTVGEVRPSVRAPLSWDVPVTVGDIVGVVTMIWSDDDGRPVPVSARHGGRREDWADGVELGHLLDEYRPLGDVVERAAREAVWRAVDHGPQPSSVYAVGDEIAGLDLWARMDARTALARERLERRRSEASASAEEHRLRRCGQHCRPYEDFDGGAA